MSKYEMFLFQTEKNYSGSKQVLSTPFLFYIGITPNKTAFDLLIKYFGLKKRFINVSNEKQKIILPSKKYFNAPRRNQNIIRII
jgi:hypothetical protein